MKLVMAVILLLLTFSFADAQQSIWKEFRSAKGRFSVLLPGAPASNIFFVDTDAGPRQSNTFSYSDTNLNEYIIAYSEYQESKAEKSSNEKLFDEIRNGIIIAQQGRLLKETPLSLGQYPGREIVVKKPGGTVQIQRFYVVNNYFYQLSVEIKNSDTVSADAERFLNSFKLLASQ